MSNPFNKQTLFGQRTFRDGSVGDSMGMPKGLKMDSNGRLVDEKGNIIELNDNKSLKINKKNERKRKTRPLLQIHRKAKLETIKQKRSDYFDPELEVTKGNKRQRMKEQGLRFNEQGSYIKKAETIRKKEISKQLGVSEDSVQVEQTKPDLPEDPKTKLMRKIDKLKPLDPVPEVEWWDAILLPEGKKNFKPYENVRESSSVPLDISDFKITDDTFNIRKCTHYVQHPVPVKNPEMEKIKNMSIPVYLTEKERKRITKLKKAEKVKDRHEKISLGLMDAPAPRLKMSSFMRAVTAQAVADPSAVEKEVRRQEAERQKAHVEHNESRKLTKQQKAEKFKSKMERDAKKETWSALFRIKSLKDAKTLFKVDRNAQQFYLKGMLINTETLKKEGLGNFPNLVIVEGGKTAVRRYKKLLLRRIKWDQEKGKKKQQDSDSEDSEEEAKDQNLKNELRSTDDCAIVWEGTLFKRYFDNWKQVEIKSEHEAIRALADRGCEHYWNQVLNFKLEDADF